MVKKQVRWSTITFHAFEIGPSGCSVPSTGGPSIGLVGTSFESYTIQLATLTQTGHTQRSKHGQYMPPNMRIQLLEEAGYTSADIATCSLDGDRCRHERKETQAELIRELYQKKLEYYLMKRQETQQQEQPAQEIQEPQPLKREAPVSSPNDRRRQQRRVNPT